MGLGRTSWWQVARVVEVLHLIVDRKQRETGKCQGQDTFKEPPK
jgi:hypothetical protein